MKSSELIQKVFVVVDVGNSVPALVTNRINKVCDFIKSTGLSISHTRRGVDGVKAVRTRLCDVGFFSVYNHDFKVDFGAPAEVFRVTSISMDR